MNVLTLSDSRSELLLLGAVLLLVVGLLTLGLWLIRLALKSQ